jgi:hypothetical protein
MFGDVFGSFSQNQPRKVRRLAKELPHPLPCIFISQLIEDIAQIAGEYEPMMPIFTDSSSASLSFPAQGITPGLF